MGTQIKNSKGGRRFRMCGLAAADSRINYILGEQAPGSVIAPNYAKTAWGQVPQYAATIRGGGGEMTYDPGKDCQGYFASGKYQPNNNCYAYACDIATNTFPQPGRQSGGTQFSVSFNAQVVQQNAVKDGLVQAGLDLEELRKFRAQNQKPGHFVALLFSAPDASIGWPGDYHWVRCDDQNSLDYWSQKDGPDQVTNFDFAGNRIRDPAKASWTVNQGPSSDPNAGGNDEVFTSYKFVSYMYVPDEFVNII
jgi:hypothetical protein